MPLPPACAKATGSISVGQSPGKRGLAGLAIASLIHAADAVVPSQAIFIEDCPKQAEADGKSREQQSSHAPTHGFARRVVVIEGAERDACVRHARGALGEGE